MLGDNTKGVLRVDNGRKTAKLIAQSECILANGGINNVQQFHFYNPGKVETKDYNQNFRLITVNSIGATTLVK